MVGHVRVNHRVDRALLFGAHHLVGCVARGNLAQVTDELHQARLVAVFTVDFGLLRRVTTLGGTARRGDFVLPARDREVAGGQRERANEGDFGEGGGVRGGHEKSIAEPRFVVKNYFQKSTDR